MYQEEINLPKEMQENQNSVPRTEKSVEDGTINKYSNWSYPQS